jgi:CRISPR system Cascade subunit CasD
MGLLGASMGITRGRHKELYELSEELDIAVQVNQCGQKITDFHTVQNFRSPQGKIQKGTKPTYREYWCDSEHTFAVSGDNSLIEDLSKHVKAPKFTLFQGRKCCPLTRPLFDQIIGINNPAIALKGLKLKGQTFSDIEGENVVAITKVRDMTTSIPRKYTMRTVFVCASPTLKD